jgi:hypothetical protein
VIQALTMQGFVPIGDPWDRNTVWTKDKRPEILNATPEQLQDLILADRQRAKNRLS